MFIDGFGIGGYRSFGHRLQNVGPLEKINLFIGQNNAGKSNLLLFLTHHYRIAWKLVQGSGQDLQLNSLDSPQGINTPKLRVSFGLKIDGEKFLDLIESIKPNLQRNRVNTELAERILRSKYMTEGTDCAWFCYERIQGLKLTVDTVEGIRAEKILKDPEWYSLWSALTGHQGGDISKHWIPETLQKLSPVIFESPKIDLVPAIRKVGEAGTDAQDFSGVGLIDRLADLQHPALHEMELKERFNQINEFLRLVTGDRGATLEIPNKRDMILVHMGGKSLPLSSLGTGIHEVVILAAAATVLRSQVLCIEEPELHLHPILQKKLIRYLQEKTDNQYFITTHSASFLDAPGAAIFHVGLENGESIVTPAVTEKAKSSICADLGYRASDLLQSNSIIWVEGPSDRIYLSHWIHAVDPSLVEGLHYSIMFYGGRLLSHLTADDPDVSQFISLRRLNRNIAILIDSDRESKGSDINSTKARVKKEFDQGPGFAWITEGREIENYLVPQVLEKALKAIKPDAVGLAGAGVYDHLWHYKTNGRKVHDDVDKVRLAHEMVNTPPNLNILDLKSQVERLVKFIHEVNAD